MDKDALLKVLARSRPDDEIYHDLMHFKVEEILLVATVYDAFILEEEGKLTEQIFGEYHQLNLSSAPRVTSVPSGEEALKALRERRFDMVIVTVRVDEITPFELSRKIREIDREIPLLLLLNNDSDIEALRGSGDRMQAFDKTFVWNGDAKVFLSMIKYIEDKINVVNDTKIGLVRVILLVEDSIRYYSRYLPILHVEIMRQTQQLIADEHLNEMKKLLRMRTRPKVLMAETYEEAMEIFDTYKDYLLCVISDVGFSRGRGHDEQAGVQLIRYFRGQIDSLPILLQSSDPANARLAAELGASFLDKNSDNLSRDLTDYIHNNLGFGDFVFRDRSGREIARASSLEEFESELATVPDESLVYHAERNHFSSWLMARGEIQIAKYTQPIKVSDFESYGDLRRHLIAVCNMVREQKTRNKLVRFDRSAPDDERNVIRLGEGSVGGKGRGTVFLNMLIQNGELSVLGGEANVLIPHTSIIGTEEFDRFMADNRLEEAFATAGSFEETKRLATDGRLSRQLKRKLRAYLQRVDGPITVRSSSLFEDSVYQPFSGMYETYFLPNNHRSFGVRLRQLETAVKLVYASVYSDSARSYFEAINYKIGEEKMAILLQKVVGREHGARFYPHVSGVAQSYNYYPISYLQPSDGIAVIGFGLGKYVVDGEKAWRFCPKYPNIDFVSQEDLARETQASFYALNTGRQSVNLLGGGDATLVRLDLSEAEKDGTLDACASVWDPEDRTVKVGARYRGPRILDFGPVLKWGGFPLASALDALLGDLKGAMGMPVEIEFAVDLTEGLGGRPSLYILQLSPLLGNLEEFNVDLADVDRRSLLLRAEKAMGNGTISDLRDIVYADPEAFDRNKTVEMVEELEGLNEAMKREGRPYILVGPGRWGSRDRWLGIPVRWPNISNARIIVEVETDEMRTDSSLGSHFFHNVTSKNIGYIHIPHNSGESFIDWEWLRAQPVADRTEHFVRVSLEKPLTAKMDGRRGIPAIEPSKLLVYTRVSSATFGERGVGPVRGDENACIIGRRTRGESVSRCGAFAPGGDGVPPDGRHHEPLCLERRHAPAVADAHDLPHHCKPHELRHRRPLLFRQPVPPVHRRRSARRHQQPGGRVRRRRAAARSRDTGPRHLLLDHRLEGGHPGSGGAGRLRRQRPS
jgi:CheY-like chemotaxis protein